MSPGVELLTPRGLWLLTLLVPLIALYILKVRRTERVVSSTWLWQAAARELIAQRPFRRLIARVPLLLQLLALLLLALALARPASRGGTLSGDHVAIVVDTSASMGAVDAQGRARIELARESAERTLARLAPGAEALLIDAGREPRLAAPLDRDVVRLRAAVARLRAQDVEGDLPRGVALAAERLRQLPGSRRLVVITDGALAKRDAWATPDVPLELIQVGSPADNAAIVRMDVRSGEDPATHRPEVQVFVRVANYGKTRRELYVTLTLRNVREPLASRMLSLEPGERAPVVLGFEPAPGDVGQGLVVTLSPGDALAADDRAYGRVPPNRKQPVVLAPKDANPWFERALLADPDVELLTTSLDGLRDPELPFDALVVVHGACPPALPGMDYVLVAPPAGRCRSATVGPPVEAPELTSWNVADPRLRFLSLDGVLLTRARRLELDGAKDALVSARQGVLMADVSEPGRSGTLIGFDVGDSTWPLKASFVLFTRNLVEQARAHRSAALATAGRTGEPIRLRIPPEVRELTVEPPQGDHFTVAAREGLGVLPSASQAGFYWITWRGQRPGSSLLSVNLTSELESDLSAPPPEAGAGVASTVTPQLAPPEAHGSWAWLVALLALGALLADAWWLTRGGRPSRERRALLVALGVLATLPSLYVLLVWLRWLPERWVRLERPLLAPALSLALLWLAQRLRRLSPRQARAQRWLTELSLAVAALGAALAALGVEVGRPLDRLAVLVVVDRSRSMELVPQVDSRLAAELQVAELGMRPDDRIGAIVFGATAAVEDPLRPHSTLPAPQRVELGRDGTDLGAGLLRALGEVPADAAARLVLLSDGVNTRGEPMDAAAAAAAAGIPIDVVPLDQAAVDDVRLVAVRLPPSASRGEPLELRVVTRSSKPAELEVRVYRDGALLRRGDARVSAGEDVLHLRELAPEPGLHRYDVELTAKEPRLDQAVEDNRGAAFVRVRGQSTALVIEGDPGQGAALAHALEGAAFRVVQADAVGVPEDVAAFAGYDLVTLSDVSATQLSPTQIEALASYARDLGGGLLLLGGDRSLGPGGFGKTALEEVSPVSFDIKQDRRRASLAQVIAIDYSGSMAARVGAHTKLQLANEAAARSAELLGSQDRLGVMHVDTVVAWTVKLAPVTDKEAVAKAIMAVGPGGGGIYVDITLREAYAALAKESTHLKHLLLFADGSDAVERKDAFTLVAAAKARGITTSTVSLGRGSDSSALEAMSKLGDGRFYLIEDAARLPTVFAQETVLAARSSINETPFRPRLGASSPATRGVDFAAAPELSGYVVTLPKGRSQTLLSGPEGDPLLSTWSVGLGRVGAFTSDFKGRWGRAWTSWGGASKLFGQLGRELARRAEDPRVRLEADASGGQLHLRATVIGDDGRTESFRRLRVRVSGPDGQRDELALEAVGAGAYAATLPLSRPGAYVAAVVDELDGQLLSTTGAVLDAGEELRPSGTDRALLGRIAALSGGQVRDTLAGIFHDRSQRRFAYRSWVPSLLVVAAGALLFSVGARRLGVPEVVRRLGRRLSHALRRRPRRSLAPLAPPSTGQAVLAARAARQVAAPAPPPASPAARARDATPPHPPRFQRPGAPPAPPRPEPTAGAAPPAPGGASAPATPPARPLTAAEILAARRRQRRP